VAADGPREDRKGRGGPREDGKGRAGSPGSDKADSVAAANQTFRQLDKDGDGKLAKDDLPESMQARFAAIDTNGDGFVDRQEWTAAMRAVAIDARERKPRTRGG
jgi:collagen type III alpha